MFRKTLVKRIFIGVLTGILLVGSFAGCGSKKTEDTNKLTGKTAAEIVNMMGIGINIGNTFDSTGGNIKDIKSLERSWGNPVVSEDWIKGCKDAGFDTIRIPITWYRAYTDSSKFTISADYLARIKEVVDWCYKYEMFVIINVHHEEWINCENLVNKTNAVKTELICVWEQIADYFGDYDQHLIFEGMNEPRVVYENGNTDWTGNQKGFEAVNELNQVFVDTVRRSSKGNNAERCLMIPGYAASCSTNAMKAIKIPQVNGEDAKNIIVSVHSYTPYNFCLTDQQSTFGSTQDKREVDNVFKGIYSTLVAKGIPVVLGETSATIQGDNVSDRAVWAEYTAKVAASYGIPIVIWDNGNTKKSGGECHAWINRYTCKAEYSEVLEALMKGHKSVEWGSAVK